MWALVPNLALLSDYSITMRDRREVAAGKQEAHVYVVLIREGWTGKSRILDIVLIKYHGRAAIATLKREMQGVVKLIG